MNITAACPADPCRAALNTPVPRWPLPLCAAAVLMRIAGMVAAQPRYAWEAAGRSKRWSIEVQDHANNFCASPPPR